jgi:histidinol-phosphate aminotransferase
VRRRLDPGSLVRPEVRALPPYTLEQTPCRFKLDQNEVPWELPASWKREVADQLAAMAWSRYPDFHADELRRDLGRLAVWPWEGVLAGNGSNELLALAIAAVAPAGGEVLGADPTFGLYRIFIVKAGARPRFLPPRPDLRLPLDELEAEVARDPRRPVLLCSPNNPTGAAAEPERLAALLDRLEAPLLLDNAYGEYCRHDYRPLLDRYPHLVLFRTFSKAWALAGLRLGYLLAHPDLVAELIKLKLPYNLNHASALAARRLLASPGPARRRTAALLGRRLGWARMLVEAGLHVFPSEGSYLLVRSSPAGEARRIRSGLAERGILVRDVGSYPGLAGCLRISVGSGPALRATRRALAEIGVEKAGVPAGAEAAP